MEGVSVRLAAYAPRANLLVVDDPPVVGAALLGLDALSVSPEVEFAVRTAILARARTPHASAKAAS
jgi:hypothetical protein